VIRLDLGAGAVSPEGFIPLGNINGTVIFPLAYGDGTVDEIRASHVLEHFPHRQVPDVIKEWVRALKPGGTLRIAVPNFEKIAEDYVAGKPQITEGYVMGGQVDEADFHKAIFDAAHLKTLLAGAGLMLIREWESELATDCAALPVSLNLGGTKPHLAEVAVEAVMSVPRLGFMDTMFACAEALPPLNVKIRRHTGAYWSQCIERVIQEVLAEGRADAILTVDYDTLFTRRDTSLLIQLLCCHPEVDAVAAMQSGRGKELPLFWMKNPDGTPQKSADAEIFAADLVCVHAAHFGLTLFRAAKFAGLTRPWFRDEPAPDGSWGEGHRDADIAFWDKWASAGNSVAIANRVPVGHLELGIRWPGKDLRAIHQPISDYRETGIPKDAWR
jgi:hypothetical protein